MSMQFYFLFYYIFSFSYFSTSTTSPQLQQPAVMQLHLKLSHLAGAFIKSYLLYKWWQ